jgi:(1->4)-alpha-D-glucan 1-alpha-D-glucosylmutase
MRVPIATYRVQLNRDFRFADARALAPYLSALGISDLYCSPIYKARPGSSHGYDVTDPLHLNPELGTEEEFDELVQELERNGMGLLLDIVPNHMAASPENPWWMDVLENGAGSPYAAYFNIEWHPAVAKGGLENKVLLPILGGPYGAVLENQELTLALDERGFFVRYYDRRLPLDPKSYGMILSHRLEPPGPAPEIAGLLEAVENLPPRSGAFRKRIEQRRRSQEIIKRRIWELYNANPRIKAFLDENLRQFNGVKGNPRSFDLLDQLLAEQAYRPAFWRLATERINYWRFFDVTDLVGIRTEDPEVFRATHALICRLASRGKISGVRIDHIDGLYDPLGYLRRLQGCLHSYAVVEKILLADDELPPEWPVSGTTGYDFLNAVNGVFVDAAGLAKLDRVYAEFIGAEVSFPETVYEEKKRVIGELFRGELRVLWNHLGGLAEQDRHARDLSPKELVEALVEVTACLPVYRTYIRDFTVSPQDRRHIEQAIAEAARRNPGISGPIFDFLRRVLLLESPHQMTEEQREARLRFVMRWQQFTGPVTAKGLEDTALYVYNRLVSLNEVGAGGRPATVESFHEFNCARQRSWPFTLNTTSTHDTKRSEDVRARINVLSEIPEEWGRRVQRWSRWNRARKPLFGGAPAPDPNEEYLLYQTLLGAWPLDPEEAPAFRQRLKSYMLKATREAKVHTSWIHPDPEHESALQTFVDRILDSSANSEFYKDFLRFQKAVAYYGALASLAQVVLKIASPGVPDFYRGSLKWDFSLVDPDNRRPVDFSKWGNEFEQVTKLPPAGLPAAVQEFLLHWEDGRIKLFVTQRCLQFRKENLGIFTEGEYLPLFASGSKAEHVLAFARRKAEAWALVAVPRLVARLCRPGRPPIGRRRWGAGAIALPEQAPVFWRNVFTGETLKGRTLRLAAVFSRFPVALLAGTGAVPIIE